MDGRIHRWACGRTFLWADRSVDGWTCGRVYGRNYGRMDLRTARTTGVRLDGRMYGWADGRPERTNGGPVGVRSAGYCCVQMFLCAERWAGVRSVGAMARRPDGRAVLRTGRPAGGSFCVRSDGRAVGATGVSVQRRVDGRSAVSAGGPIGLSTNRAVGGRISGRACLRAGLPVVRSDTPTHNPAAAHRADRAAERSGHGTHEGSVDERTGARIRQRIGVRSKHATPRRVDLRPGRPLSGSVAGCPGGRGRRTSEHPHSGSQERQSDPANIRWCDGTYDVSIRASPFTPLPDSPALRPRTGQRRLGITRCLARERPPQFSRPRRRMRTHPNRTTHNTAPPQSRRTEDRRPGRAGPPGRRNHGGRPPGVEQAGRTRRPSTAASERTRRRTESGCLGTGRPMPARTNRRSTACGFHYSAQQMRPQRADAVGRTLPRHRAARAARPGWQRRHGPTFSGFSGPARVSYWLAAGIRPVRGVASVESGLHVALGPAPRL
ncbi:hypothetical protein EHYA_02339 [Embleya hyalina]|uniref:Uncharacterized protein n=1 Tax=Embleya hyalina TaxID=516124 RepID=A0A401YJ87_9ACTN|nr:hypothetical protein EHYA_02339 [Embleya hyalina]